MSQSKNVVTARSNKAAQGPRKAKNQKTRVQQRRRARSRAPPSRAERNVVVAPGMSSRLSAPPANKSAGSTIDKWVSMMLNPRDVDSVLSPSPGGAGVFTTRARFNFVREIAYDAALGGYFSVIATPSVKDPLMLMTTTPRYPAAGTTQLEGASKGFAFGPNGSPSGDPVSGWLFVRDTDTGDGVAMLNLKSFQGHKAWQIQTPVGAQRTYSVQNKGPYTRNLRRWIYQGGAWAFSTQITLKPGEVNIATTTVAGSDEEAFTFTNTNAAGATGNPADLIDDLVPSYYGAGFIPAADAPGSVASFVPDELADQGRIENVRVTAMSLLVSPVGQWQNIGGRLVMARTLASNIVTAQTIAEMMQKVESLNDQKTWIDPPIAKGGYAWWMPDDPTSYAVHAYNQTPSTDENVLLACGRMEAGNSLRIVATYVVEFYSPKQIFDKNWGPALNGPYMKAFEELLHAQAVSENEEHLDMISRIKSGVKSALAYVPAALRFAATYGPDIAEGAAMAAAML